MKIGLFGYGKMGKAIEQMAVQQSHEVAFKIDAANAASFPIQDLQHADVCIDFSTPDVAFDNIKKSISAGIPIVSGTTGWLNRKNIIDQFCLDNNGTFLYASNFSIGVNIFFSINKKLSQMMAKHHYIPSLEEIHHTQKLDAPSGTAISLAKDIIESSDELETWINQSSDSKKELGVISKRIDHVPGTHQINWSSPIDTIELKHTAHSRQGFVIGALLAANFVKDKKGIFTMNDVLDL